MTGRSAATLQKSAKASRRAAGERPALKLSLVIPCYNEEKGLPALVARCTELAAAIDAEIILVNNGSKDNSAAVLTDLLRYAPGCRSVTIEVNQGYGFGILAGLREARGDIVGWTHADMQTDPMDAVKAMDIYRTAKRPERLFLKGRRYGRPLSDRFFTFGMTVFETLLIGKVLADVNAQPTLFPRKFYEGWRNAPHDFSLDLFAYATAKMQRMRVKRFPVLFAKRQHGQSSWNVNWSAKQKFIKRTLDYSFRLRQQFNGVFGDE